MIDELLETARRAGVSGLALNERGRVVVYSSRRIPFTVYRKLRRERKIIQERLEGTARPFLELK